MTISITADVTFRHGTQLYTSGQPYDVADNLAHLFMVRRWASGAYSGSKSVDMVEDWREGATHYLAGSTYTIPQPLADFLIEVGLAAAVSDALSTALAPLSAGVWSGNIATNTLRSVNPTYPNVDGGTAWKQHYRCKDAGYTGSDPTFGTEDPFAFGSGTWAGARKKYIVAGGGGHTNGACGESYAFDAPTLAWALRDLGATLADGSYEDPGAVVQATDPNGWRAWPNANGRRCPIPCHVYASLDYDPDNDLVCVLGGGSYLSGQGNAGGMFCVDGATGNWNQDYVVAADGRVEANSFWLDCDDGAGGTVKRVFVARDSGTADAIRVDPIGGSATESALSQFASNAPDTAVGTVIPDPATAGRKAYAYYNDDTHFAYLPSIDVVGGFVSNGVQIAYGNTKPAGITNNSTWMYVAGWGSVPVWQPGDGLYALNLTDHTWSAKLADDPNTGGLSKIYRRIFPIPEYGAFGLFNDDGSEFRAMKYPVGIG